MDQELQLPQELIELIIDRVANDKNKAQRRSTLQSCALTSWSLLTPARRIIFEEVYLIEDEGNNSEESSKDRSRLKDFLQLLEKDPCHRHPDQPPLARHIKSIEVVLSAARISRNSRCTTASSEGQQESILASILRMIPCIQTFKQSFQHADVLSPQDYRFRFLDEDLKKTLFCLPCSVVNLQFSDIESIPLSIFSNYPNLRSLSLHGAVLQVDTRPPGSRHHSTSLSTPTLIPKLERLSIVESWSVLFDLSENCLGPSASYLQLSSLQTLEIPSSTPAWSLLKAFPSLRRLRIQLGRNWGQPHRDFGIMRGLEVIEICGDILGLRDLCVYDFFSVTAGGSSQPSFVHTIVIFVEGGRLYPIQDSAQRVVEPPGSGDAGWPGINALFSSGAFPKLHTLRVKFNLFYKDDKIVSAQILERALLDQVQGKLPRLLPLAYEMNSVQIQLSINAHIGEELVLASGIRAWRDFTFH